MQAPPGGSLILTEVFLLSQSQNRERDSAESCGRDCRRRGWENKCLEGEPEDPPGEGTSATTAKNALYRGGQKH